MAQGLTGADVDALRRLAVALDAASTRLSAMAAQQSAAAASRPSAGVDAEECRAVWTTECRPRLTRAAAESGTAADALRRNAAEQQTASATEAGSGAGGLMSQLLGIGAAAGAGVDDLASLLDQLDGFHVGWINPWIDDHVLRMAAGAPELSAVPSEDPLGRLRELWQSITSRAVGAAQRDDGV